MSTDRDNARILTTAGANLRAERSRRGLSQEELGHRSGFGTTQIARMERGESDSGLSRYVRVAWALGVSPREFFQGLDGPDSAP